MEDLNSVLNIVLLLVFCVLVYSYIFKPKKHYPPGPWGFPILGHLPFFGTSPSKTLRIWASRYGNVFRINLGSWNAVVLNGYSTIKEVLEREDDVFSSRPDFLSTKIAREDRGGEESMEFGPFNEAYMKQRKLTAYALRRFTNIRYGCIQEIIKEETETIISHLLSRKGIPYYEENTISFSVASIIYQVLFGKGVNAREDSDLAELIRIQESFVECVGSANAIDVLPWLRFILPKKIEKFLHFVHLSDKIIRRKVNEHKSSFDKNDLRDVTDVFISAGLPKYVKDKTVDVTEKRQMITLADLLGAGFGTLSRTMHWLILYMIAYPDVQKRVQREIDDVVGHGRTVVVSDKFNLPYTRATILEVMRINTVDPLALPYITSSPTTVNDFDVDEGTVVIVNLQSANHDETIWDSPEMFKPERHLDTAGELKKRSPVSPFGFGRRKCIGEHFAKTQLFLLFAMLMQRCAFLKPDEDNIDLRPVEHLLISPKPFRVIVTERQ